MQLCCMIITHLNPTTTMSIIARLIILILANFIGCWILIIASRHNNDRNDHDH